MCLNFRGVFKAWEVLAFGETAWKSLTHDKMKNQFDLMMLTSTYEYTEQL